ncbi:MAG: endonuclease [Prevotella sp.]|nr:endonuclease [Prevotella sp.]
MKTRKLLLLSAMALVTGAVWAQGPNETGTYYKNANGQSGENLRTALSKIIGGPSVTSYDGLISAYEKTDTRPDGYVRDWYSNTTHYRHGKDTGGYKQEGDSYNREHSVPQSWFNKKSPMKSDIVHVVPTDGYVNNRRSSYPFGEVSKATYTSNNSYCKLGSSKTAGYTSTVFEPNDEVKGDIARIYFYMATCYKEQCAGWGGNIFTKDGIIKWELDQMLAWSKLDPVDAVETARNNAVYGVQKNRNPFVDYPGLEEYIWGSKKDQRFSYDQYEGGTVVDVPTVATPTFTPDAGTYYNKVEVTIACATEGATIYYTTDGADASNNSLVYHGPITLTKTSTIKAMAMKDGKQSYQTSAFYLITEEEQPGDEPDGEEPVDGTIQLTADFFETSFTGPINSSYEEDLTGTQNGVSVVYSLAEGSNRYANNSQIRLYPGNKLIFSVAQGLITGLEFTFDSGTPSQSIEVEGQELADGVWNGSAKSVTVTLGSGKHARLTSVKVLVSGATGIDFATTTTLDGQRVVYNLRGQRVAHPQRGMYIVDGKKIFIE